ncbi:E2 [Gammapapillomavirus 7]|uniref:Regulatory protein E2 n=1 Tax=Gammapapillomavirus 7 TaxID=1175849 RepID=A0A2D2ALC5_9PAPI|nr:E2 [Gammapapillomavirus 7]
MESLAERFDALQENQLTLYETGSTNIEDQILYWDTVRQEYVLFHYARQRGLSHIGLQPVPTLTVSEQKAKQAILMVLQLKSLKQSQFGNEPWTMQDTSYELFNTAPSNTFKKGAYTVDVYYDGDEDNYFPYTAWSYIYYQNGDNEWHKVKGDIDYEGLFYKSHDGEKVYYVTFYDDATRFSRTGKWTVRYKNTTISSTSITSTSGPTGNPTSKPSSDSVGQKATEQASKRRQRSPSPSSPRHTRSRTWQSDGDTSSSSPGISTRRRRREGKSTTQRRERPSRATSPGVAPEEVGRRHRFTQRKGLSRLGQLQEDARDPPIILLKGPANTLKCYRFRCRSKCRSLIYRMSTVFSWVGEGPERLGEPRMLLAFKDKEQRQRFLSTVHLPKGTHYSLGNLNSL